MSLTLRTLKFPRWLLAAVMAFYVGVIALVLVASCAPHPAPAAERAARVRIPEVSVAYRMRIEREAVRNFGLEAPAARLAAQVHQESAWRPDAASPYAQGLAQFTPATARWLPQVCPAVGAPDAWDPDWSLRAQACYMAWLHRRVPRFPGAGLAPCSRWAFALRAYNGGEGWVARERRLASAAGADPNDWLAVQPFRARAPWAHRENTDYPRRILLRLEPAYLAAGWTGTAVCP